MLGREDPGAGLVIDLEAARGEHGEDRRPQAFFAPLLETEGRGLG